MSITLKLKYTFNIEKRYRIELGTENLIGNQNKTVYD